MPSLVPYPTAANRPFPSPGCCNRALHAFCVHHKRLNTVIKSYAWVLIPDLVRFSWLPASCTTMSSPWRLIAATCS